MGRAVIDFPLGEIASFIADPNSAPLFDKFVTVSSTRETVIVADILNVPYIIYRRQERLTACQSLTLKKMFLVSLTHLLTHSLIHSLIHYLTHSLTHSLFHLLTVYYKTEAKQCLVKAVRDLLFYVRHAHFVSTEKEQLLYTLT